MKLNYSIIGMRLKQARLDKKITQEKLAEMLDVSVAYISRVECGSTEINMKRLAEICGLLDVSLSYVLEDISPTSSAYLNTAFTDLLKNCPPEKIDLIYKIAKFIIWLNYLRILSSPTQGLYIFFERKESKSQRLHSWPS